MPSGQDKGPRDEDAQAGPPAPDEAQHPERRGHTFAWIQPMTGALAALVGAFIGGMFTFLATRASVDSSLEQQARTFVQQEQRVTQDRRAEVYSSLLAAASDYADGTEALLPFVRECGGRGDLDARTSFRTAMNDVFIYGSDDAVIAAQALAQPLSLDW